MTEEFTLETPETTADDLLELDDPHFTGDDVAIVTGGASGIGRATAMALAHNGLAVAATDVDAGGLDGTVAKAEEIGATGEVHAVEGDLTEEDDIVAIVEEAAELGDVRYLANVAGMQHIASLSEFPTARYDLLQEVMLRAPFLLTREVIPHVEATDDGVGAVANMSSVHGHVATVDKAAYVTMKHGLNGLTRAVAAEGGGTLRAFTVSVGYVLTPLMVNQIEDTARERGISEQEVVEDVMLGPARTKEMMTPAQVANLFAFGLSSYGQHLNGGDLLWDGGFTLTYE